MLSLSRDHVGFQVTASLEIELRLAYGPRQIFQCKEAFDFVSKTQSSMAEWQLELQQLVVRMPRYG